LETVRPALLDFPRSHLARAFGCVRERHESAACPLDDSTEGDSTPHIARRQPSAVSPPTPDGEPAAGCRWAAHSEVLLAYGGIFLLTVLSPDNLPRIGDVAIDGRVLAYTSVVSVLTGIIFGLAPSLGVAYFDVSQPLKGQRSTPTVKHSRLRSAPRGFGSCLVFSSSDWRGSNA